MSANRAGVRAALAAVLLASLLTALLGAGAPPARAQADDPPAVDLDIREVDGVVDPTDEAPQVRLRLALDAGRVDREDLRLVTTAFTRPADRDELREVLDGGDPEAVFSARSQDLPDMAAGTRRLVDVAVDARDLALIGRGRDGVYPLQLQLFEGGEPVGQVRTAVVVLPEEAPPALPAAVAVRVQDDALPALGDTATAGLEAAVAPDGDLRGVAAELRDVAADGSAAGMSLVLEGRLLDDLAAMADGYTAPDGDAVAAEDRAARRAARVLEDIAGTARRSDVQVVALPYGPADLVALVRGGAGAAAAEAASIGPAAVRAATGAAVADGVLVPPDGLDARTLAAVGAAGTEAVLLGERYLGGVGEDADQPVRRLLTADGGAVRILVPDADLSALLADPAGGGSAAVLQRVLAETAMAWLGQEPSPRPGGSEVATPDDDEAQQASRRRAVLLDVDAADLRSGLLPALQGALGRTPWLRPVNLSTLLARVDAAERPVRLAYPQRAAARELPAAYVAQLQDARAALDPLAALLPSDDPAARTLAASLRAAASTAFRGRQQADGLARTAAPLTVLDELRGGVSIAPSPPITLTAALGEVPVTVANDGAAPVSVRVEVEGARFAFPSGAAQDVDLPPNASRRLIFEAQALNPGGFAPVEVTVTDPGRDVVLTRARLSVRSTAFPVVGLLAAVGSALVLLVWGVRQGRRLRRPGRHERRAVDAA